jgi:hypothetical protein
MAKAKTVKKTSKSKNKAEKPKKAVGAPTKYNAAMQAKAEKILTRLWEDPDGLPSILRLSIELGIGRKTLYVWGEKHQAFRHILDLANSLQECKIIERAMQGHWNSNIAKLVLGKHGYHDKVDSNVSGGFKIEGDGSEPVSAAIAKALGKND